MVRVVAHLRGQIERHRESGLALGEQEPEALVVQGLLESAGIDAELMATELVQDAFPGLGGVVLLVNEEDAEAAEKIIESYRNSPPVDDETAEISG